MSEYIIYDCEIIKCIPQKGVNLEKFYEMCKGWDDFKNMGISCVGLGYSDGTLDCWASHKEPLQALQYIFQKVARNKKIVGFNSKSFDDNLMAANGVIARTDYDLLEEIRLAAYGSSRWEDTPPGFSYSLDAIARANGEAKSGSGALAPQLWQQEKYQEVIDYCLNDVKITKKLLHLGLEGKLKDPNTGKLLQLRPL